MYDDVELNLQSIRLHIISLEFESIHLLAIIGC